MVIKYLCLAFLVITCPLQNKMVTIVGQRCLAQDYEESIICTDGLW